MLTMNIAQKYGYLDAGATLFVTEKQQDSHKIVNILIKEAGEARNRDAKSKAANYLP